MEQIEIPFVKLCECGCGNPAPIAKYTNKRFGHIKGKPIRFINSHWSKTQPRGKESYRWTGGRNSYKHSRKLDVFPKHMNGTRKGNMARYRLYAEKILGKSLPKKSVIHHFYSGKNIVICQNRAYHLLLHQRQNAYENCGYANWRKCYICKKYDDPTNLYFAPNGRSTPYHRKCKSEVQKQQYQEKK